MFIIATFALQAMVASVASTGVLANSPMLHPTVDPAIFAVRVNDHRVPISDTIPPSLVITDSLLLRWHLSLVHVYDTLRVHPELQTLPGLAPLLNDVDCHAWTKPVPPDSAAAVQGVSLARGPNTSVVAVLTQTVPLASAIRTGGSTPEAWVTTTSAIVQEECASQDFYTTRDSIGHWPVDSTSALGKNLVYFWGWKTGKGAQPLRAEFDKRYLARLSRIRAYGLGHLNYSGLRSPSGNPTVDQQWGNRMEAWPEVQGQLIDASGQEIPVPTN